MVPLGFSVQTGRGQRHTEAVGSGGALAGSSSERPLAGSLALRCGPSLPQTWGSPSDFTIWGGLNMKQRTWAMGAGDLGATLLELGIKALGRGKARSGFGYPSRAPVAGGKGHGHAKL